MVIDTNREPLALHRILDRLDKSITELIFIREALCRIMEKGEDE
jgi:hypothetical protein